MPPAAETPRTRDMKLEVVVIPVSDADRVKRFYGGLGWRLDADFVRGDEFRVIQLRLPARRARSSSAREPRRPSRARHRDFILSCPTSRRRTPSWPVTASISANSSTPRRRAPPCRPKRSPQRPGSSAAQLRLVRLVQRSGRQRLALPGGHRAIARARGRGRHDIHIVD